MHLKKLKQTTNKWLLRTPTPTFCLEIISAGTLLTVSTCCLCLYRIVLGILSGFLSFNTWKDNASII